MQRISKDSMCARVIYILDNHDCEECSKRKVKSHLLNTWIHIINEELPHSFKFQNIRQISKMFQILKGKGYNLKTRMIRLGGLKAKFYVYKKSKMPNVR